MKKRALMLIFLLGFSLLLNPIAVEGQFGGGGFPKLVGGFVFDVDGEPLVGANVTLTNENTSESLWTVSDGFYMFDLNQLPSGVTEGNMLTVTAVLGYKTGQNSTLFFVGASCDVYVSELIEHAPMITVDEGEQTIFSALILDEVNATGAELRVWISGQDVSVYGMEQSGNNWRATVLITFDHWPSFNYSINATDGLQNISTPIYTTMVNDTQPPTIDYAPTSQNEGTDIRISGVSDDHGLVGGNVTYQGNSIPLNITTGEATIPAQDVQIPNISFTINAWDTNNMVSEAFIVEVLDTTSPSLTGNFTATSQSGTLNITLDWDAATDNVAVEKYRLERSLNGVAWDWSVNLSSSAGSYVDSGEDPLTQYFYRIRARDVRNNWGPYAETNATTSDVNPPTITHQAITTWNESTDMEITALIEDDNIVQSIYVWYDNGTASDTIPVFYDGTRLIPPISGSILAIGEFNYRIEATDGVNWGQTETFIVEVLDATPPSLPGNFTATPEPGTLNITLEWDAATDNVAVERYELERSIDNLTWDWQVNLSSSTLSYVDSDGEQLTTYYYRICARDALFNRGAISVSNAMTSDASPPNITHQAISVWDEGIDLEITALIEDENGTQSAFVWFDNGSADDMVPMSFDGINWTATIGGGNLTIGYFGYRIGATDGIHWRETNVYEVNVQDTTSPSTVLNFSAMAERGTLDILLEWDSATDNVAVEGYELERSLDNVTWDWQADLSPYADEYIDNVGEPQTHYYYRIRARDALNNTGLFAEFKVTSSNADPPTITHQANSAWDERTDMVISAVIEDEGDTINAYVWFDNGITTERIPMVFDGANWIATINGEHIQNPTYTPESNLIYRIEASDGNHWHQTDNYEVWVLDNTPPGIFNLSVSLIEVGEGVYPSLSWTSATDNLGVQNYSWRVSTEEFGDDPEEPFFTTQENGIIYTDALSETHYYFAVAAYDGRNLGPWVFNDTSTPVLAVDEVGPNITHDPPWSAKVGKNLKLSVTITDLSGVSGSEIIYWTGEEEDGQRVIMRYVGGDEWQGIIPFSFVIGSQMRYYIISSDGNGIVSYAGNSTNPYNVRLMGKEVMAMILPSVTTGVVLGESKSLEIDLNTSSTASWYIELDLDDAESFVVKIGNYTFGSNSTLVLLEAGEHTINITAIFPSNLSETATGMLYINQSDANNNRTVALTFLIEPSAQGTPETQAPETPWPLYGLLGAIALLLIVGLIVIKKRSG